MHILLFGNILETSKIRIIQQIAKVEGILNKSLT